MDEIKIRKIVQEVIQKYTDGRLFLTKESVGNIFTMSDRLRNNPLMEGYFASYDMDKVKAYLDKRYNGGAKIYIFDNDNGEKVFRVITTDEKQNKDIIDKDMSMAGYYPSYVSRPREGIIDIQYEPRHQNSINDIVRGKDYIYHLTPSNRTQKIMSMGLTPRTNNKMFEYPERIYFFLEEPDGEICLNMIQQLSQYEKRKYKEYTLLKINTEKVKDNNFYFDPNAEDCIYTKENIRPEAIEIERTFKI